MSLPSTITFHFLNVHIGCVYLWLVIPRGVYLLTSPAADSWHIGECLLVVNDPRVSG